MSIQEPDWTETPDQTIATLSNLYLLAIKEAVLQAVNPALFDRMEQLHKRADAASIIFLANGANMDWVHTVEKKVEAFGIIRKLRESFEGMKP